MSATPFQYCTPTRLMFGPGTVRELPEVLNALGSRRPLLVTDKGVMAAGLIDGVVEHLGKALKRAPATFAEVEPNPTIEAVDRGLEIYRASGCDGLVAIGGGSVMDATKGIGILASNGGSLAAYEGLDRFDKPLPPLVAIPTTCGTGSEVTRYCIVTDPQVRRKRNLACALMFPKVAILDPDLLATLPQSQIAATGMDALSHAIESYGSRLANPVTDALNESALALMHQSLLHGYASRDGDAMANLLLASTLAGMAIGNTRGGLIHAMSHPITAWAGTPHGVANAILLPPIMRYNALGAIGRYSRLAAILDPRGSQVTESLDLAFAAADAVDALRQRLGIPAKLSDVGVTRAMVPHIVEETMQGPQLSSNPRIVTRAAVEAIADELLA